MATTNEKLTAAGLILLTGLLSMGGSFLLNPDNPVTYQCLSKGFESGCVNGVKACSNGICTRCYYDPENTRLYEYCVEGWEKKVVKLNPIHADIPITPSQPLGEYKYLCDEFKCVPLG